MPNEPEHEEIVVVECDGVAIPSKDIPDFLKQIQKSVIYIGQKRSKA